VRKGYATKAHRQPYWYQIRYLITAEGWAVADSIRFSLHFSRGVGKK
jgi:hypothetical protein